MKKVFGIVLCVIIAVIAVITVYRFCFRKSIPQGATQEEQVMAILTQNDCFECHSSEAKTVFYENFPIIGEQIKEHKAHGVKFVDLGMRLKDIENVDEVTLSMIDHTVCYGQMPPASYKAMHWGTGFNNKEKSILTEWIRAKRGYDEPICAIPESIDYDTAMASLGERMFNDKRISLDGTLSCATCHILDLGGADETDERTSEGINGQHGGVNAPTVYNSVYNIRQFWNGRAVDLAEQAEGPATNPVEMGDQTWDQIVERLSADKELLAEFETMFPEEGMTKKTITTAIAEFEKQLITPNCRFDQYLKGDKTAMTDEEIAGYESFKRNACATCHVGVSLGGRSFEYLGIFGDYYGDRSDEIKQNADDDGLKSFTGKNEDLYRFKVPTLRNIERTAPYFHDGQYQTMEEAVKAMAKYELGKDLSDQEVKEIVAFMRALTGESKYYK